MRIPIATYRLQMRPEFGFSDAQHILSYLAELGISDIYASPIFKARQGSGHGYDIVDPNQLNPELGSEDDFTALMDTLHDLAMGWVQDIVPNHMAYDSQNPFLMDILEHGPDSEYADYFDIEWEHPYDDFKGKLLTPMLGDFYGKCLENGEIQLDYSAAGLHINYYHLRIPLRIESYARFLTHDLGRLSRSLGRSSSDFMKLLGILYIVKNISAETTGRERKDQVEFVKDLLWELYSSNDDVKAFIDHNLKLFNGKVGRPESFELLDGLLSEQFFRLAFWKVGAEELNYRRFFTINELICVRVEDHRVFQKTHHLISQLVQSEHFTGLRIDHLDGLYDPTQYLRRLREKLDDIFLVVEKILELNEELPNWWPIQGTSGYDFLNQVNSLFCCQAHESAFNDIYRQVSGVTDRYADMVIAKKRLIAETNLVGDVDNLAHLLKRIAGQYRYGRDFTLSGLKKSILEVLVQFPIYCTYVNRNGISQRDQHYIETAIAQAKQRIPQLVNELTLIEKLLLLNFEDFLSDDEKNQWLHFVMRFQQFSGPLMAKGIEDTLFYVYNRLISLNEVGGHPDHFGIAIDDFHHFNQKTLAHWPHALNATATHDTKRSEDMRARLNVLSEIPQEWAQQVHHWQQLNQPHKQTTAKRVIPDANDEYFLYQTLVGIYPFQQIPYSNGKDDHFGTDHGTFLERITQYVVKAVREAKVYTAWLRADTEYEAGFIRFVQAILDPSPDNEFFRAFRPFQEKVAAYGLYNSLSQTLLKIASPGVPDFYQGTELWDLSLVDPDNRRPVDYDERLSFLQEIKRRCQTGMTSLLSDLKATRYDGRLKLFLIIRALAARQQYLEVFQTGDYYPLVVNGQFADHVIAFARHAGNTTAIAIAPRFLTSLITPDQEPLGNAVWADTHVSIPSALRGPWQDALTDLEILDQSQISIGKILQTFPVALLISRDDR
ncbi:Alpha amylase, catalytic region [Halomicronema hongdechloris C2206]|uniref:Alpha amylase, catalytic region n=1 Tax=Halomicronema hongdechloris C2206 TaxID=1641165 RepID=A0A1Z3HUM6_9CYAN|nr:malto-oligosyltrehalose synthase [Halomicronema hongdechloris]ASC74020.1 Alpha amylase, catalytic region [Halomicronema hongdechloris C2206]